MSFIEFLNAHWSSLLVVIFFIVACVILIKKGYAKYVKQILFYLVCEAEAQFGSGTGALKYSAVTAWLYDKIPAICKFFFTAKQIDTLIETAVTEMKKWLSTNEKASALIVSNIEIE